MNLKPLTGARRMSSIINMRFELCTLLTCHCLGGAFAAFEFQSNMYEVIRGPGTGVLKRQFAFVLGSNLLDLLVEFNFSIALNQKRSVHNHSIADRLVRAGGHCCVA